MSTSASSIKDFKKKVTDFLLSKLPASLRDQLLGLKRNGFQKKLNPAKKLFIFLVDGKNYHGGFTDRMNGIISCFAYCLATNTEFRISYTYPFNIIDFLEPNTYNWQLKSDDIVSYNIFETRYLNIIGDHSIKRLIQLQHSKKQIHCYANRNTIQQINDYFKTNYTWGELFKMLFRPTAYLSSELLSRKNKLPSQTYKCLVFRFQNLLGDFSEYDYQPLDTDQKKELIEACKQAIIRITSVHPADFWVICSDSALFLRSAKNVKNVVTFPEKNVHLDTDNGNDLSNYLKTFIDFYLLTEAKEIITVGTSRMYPSQFGEYAAKVNEVLFSRISI